eukprot:COSAG02_NODE_693_length_18428_cov_268.516722_9_plen_1031_part_00
MLRQLGGALATYICTLQRVVSVQQQSTGYPTSSQLEHCRTPCPESHATRCCDLPAGGADRSRRVVTIHNSRAVVDFESSGTDGWPVRIHSVPTQSSSATQQPVGIALRPRSAGSWEVALHNETDVGTLLRTYPSNCSSFQVQSSRAAELWMVWRSCEAPVGTTNSRNDALGGHRVLVNVQTHWFLPADSDTLHTTIQVDVTNAADTAYRLWLVRHPQIAIEQIGQNGSDRLARGVLGGEVLGDPIGYREPISGHTFRLTGDPNHDSNIISVDSIDPGSWTVPVAAYYDTQTGTGLYMANNDSSGYVKGTYLEHVDDALGYSVVQYPDANIYDASQYSSPYSVLLAVLPRKADWIAACTKYREETYQHSAWYNGPAGSSTNRAVPGRMKTNPIFADFHTGNGYTAAGMQGDAPGIKSVPAFNASAVASRVDFLSDSFDGASFPMALLDRFMYDPPTEITVKSGYSPSPEMAKVHELVRSMEASGHHTVVHSLTEKIAVDVLMDTGNCREPCEQAASCDQPPWGHAYCSALDPDLLDLNTANEPLMNPLVAAPWWHFGAVYCTAGPPNTASHSHENWAEWFSDVSASIANTLGASGGHAWNEPTAMAGWCFDKNHSHVPGFGSWMAQGWKKIMQSVKDKMKPELTEDGLPFIIESACAFFSDYVSVQNDVAMQFAGALATPPLDPSAPQMWSRAPIWQVPMMQYAADNMRIGDMYSQPTLSLPYTSAMSHPWFVNISDTSALQALWLFEPFPAITGALSCWSMAKRVLARQGTLLLSDNMMVEIDRLQSPGTDPASLAAIDMTNFYKAIYRFLRTKPHMEYHTGSIVRPPRVDLTNATESFRLSAAHLPQLAAAMKLVNYSETMEINWEEFHPLNDYVGRTETYGTIWLPTAPEDPLIQSWLPHGMYRHHDGISLALFISNPWGVRHRNTAGKVVASMNPFGFNFSSPHESVATTYSFKFTFDPADYTGFPRCFIVKSASYRQQLLSQREDSSALTASGTEYKEKCGPTELQGTVAAFQFWTYVFLPSSSSP